MATHHGVICTGTLGLLVAAVDKGIIDLATGNALLKAMIAADYRSPVQVLDGFV